MAGGVTLQLPFRQNVTECIFPECGDPVDHRGLCVAHYAQWLRNGDLKPKRAQVPPRECSFKDCGRPHARHGWCEAHAVQALTTGYTKPINERRTKYLVRCTGGYVKAYLPGHPNAQKNGYVLQHVLVMSALLGRPLLPEETVHHINGERDDNRPVNLELWSHSHPSGQRVEDKVAWAIELLSTYRPELLSTRGE